jgi:hypothetical protein
MLVGMKEETMPIHNYGTYWKWPDAGFTDAMWGKRGRGSPVNFRSQIGIYTLEKDEKIIYVGRSAVGDTAAISGRVYHHYKTKDRGSWNTFSWYGFRPVTPAGGLYRTPRITMDTGAVISDIEALLIGVLEPEINATSGRYKHMHHYEQVKK